MGMFQPDICLMQVHDVKIINYDFIMQLKDEFKDTIFISWNGDYNPKTLSNKDYMLVMKQFDIASFVTAEIAADYLDYGINYRYWQLGYEEYIPLKKYAKEAYDVVFLGNCYSSARQAMGEMLRYNKTWKTGLFGKWPSHLKADGQNQYDFAEGDLIYRAGKIAIGDNQFSKSLGYTSNRLFQALHSGAFLLQQTIPGLTKFLGFENGKHLVQWSNLDELQLMIEYYLKNPEQREEIARAGKEFCDKYHSFKNRVDEFDKMVQEVSGKKVTLVNH
jgi:glycosyltransferase involved in cell wall biosynthesis